MQTASINDHLLDFDNLSISSVKLENDHSLLGKFCTDQEDYFPTRFHSLGEEGTIPLENLQNFEVTEAAEFDFENPHLEAMSEVNSWNQSTSPTIPDLKHPSSEDIGDILSLGKGRMKNEDKPIEVVEQSKLDWSNAVNRSLIQVAIRTIEENILKISDYLGEFGQFERLFIANILQIKLGSTANWAASNEDFVTEVNALLDNHREKRKDDCLRFVYKRAIKFLLTRCTGYKANKNHTMEDFSDRFISYYFGAKDGANFDILDTSYASRKKIKKYCQLSQSFKTDFFEVALEQIMTEYDSYKKDHYTKMFAFFTIEVQWGTSNEKILFSKFKRLPWRKADLQMSVNLVQDLSV